MSGVVEQTARVKGMWLGAPACPDDSSMLGFLPAITSGGEVYWESSWGIVAGCFCLPLRLEHSAILAGGFLYFKRHAR